MKTTIHQLYPDLWHQIFEYFNAIELFSSLMHITREADEVLFNKNHHLYLRGLVLDVHTRTLPKKLFLSQVISLELHQNNRFDNIQQCLELRSIKLVGHSHWIISLLRKISQINLRLEQLTLIVPGISLLHNLLASITPLLSLRRLEIRGDELEEKIERNTSLLTSTNIEQFTLHSSTAITWNSLSCMLPTFPNIRFLDITLLRLSKNPPRSFVFPNVRSVSLMLLAVPFDHIVQLTTIMPSLVKLNLKGLVDAEGFVINNQWLHLFESCSSLLKITVSLSLEEDTNSYFDKLMQAALRELNLNLRRVDDDCACHFDTRLQCRWWNLSGMIIKQNRHIKGEDQTPF